VLRTHVHGDDYIDHKTLRALGTRLKLPDTHQCAWTAFVNSIYLEGGLWYRHIESKPQSVTAARIDWKKISISELGFDLQPSQLSHEHSDFYWWYGNGHEQSEFFCTPRNTFDLHKSSTFKIAPNRFLDQLSREPGLTPPPSRSTASQPPPGLQIRLLLPTTPIAIYCNLSSPDMSA